MPIVLSGLIRRVYVMPKVFIVTGEELAEFSHKKQSVLLDAIESVALQYPDAPILELLAYARQELVPRNSTPEDWTYASDAPVNPNTQLSIEQSTEEVENFVVLDPEPVDEEPAVEVDPVIEPVVSEDTLEVDDSDEVEEIAPEVHNLDNIDIDPDGENLDEVDDEEEEDQSMAFRRRRYQGLFHEASKLDEF